MRRHPLTNTGSRMMLQICRLGARTNESRPAGHGNRADRLDTLRGVAPRPRSYRPAGSPLRSPGAHQRTSSQRTRSDTRTHAHTGLPRLHPHINMLACKQKCATFNFSMLSFTAGSTAPTVRSVNTPPIILLGPRRRRQERRSTCMPRASHTRCSSQGPGRAETRSRHRCGICAHAAARADAHRERQAGGGSHL